MRINASSGGAARHQIAFVAALSSQPMTRSLYRRMRFYEYFCRHGKTLTVAVEVALFSTYGGVPCVIGIPEEELMHMAGRELMHTAGHVGFLELSFVGPIDFTYRSRKGRSLCGIRMCVAIQLDVDSGTTRSFVCRVGYG